MLNRIPAKDPEESLLPRMVTIKLNTEELDSGGTNVFMDPEGKFHQIVGANFLAVPPPEGYANVLAIQHEIDGRVRRLYVAVTKAEMDGHFWEDIQKKYEAKGQKMIESCE